ncbi:Exo-alpha-(1-_6)-L-arabinopyranosidase [compost metagenome]
MHDPVCTVSRPFKELKAFKKIFLEAGETKSVEMEIKVADLAFYDEDKKDWNIEAGDFVLQLGNSSGNISQKLKITVRE